MQRTNRMVLSLIAVLVLGSMLALFGCGDDDDDGRTTEVRDTATASSTLGGRAFAFSDGTAFGVPANAGTTTLSFNSNASRFSLTNGSRRATGATSFASCTFNVGNSTNPDAVGGGSTFPSGSGPQPNQSFTANPCTFNNDGTTLTITIGGVTSTSSSATGTGTGGFGS